MSEQIKEAKPQANPTLEQAIAKAEGLIKSKAAARGQVTNITTYSSLITMLGNIDVYTIEGNLEIETAPEVKDFLGRIKQPRRFQSILWKVQLKMDDLATVGFELRG